MSNKISIDTAEYLLVLESMIRSINDAGYSQSVILTGGYSLDMKLMNMGKDNLCRKTTDIDLDFKSMVECLRLFDNIVEILNNNRHGIVFEVTKRRKSSEFSAGVVLSANYAGSVLKVKIDASVCDFKTLRTCFVDNIPIPVYDDYTALCDKLMVASTEKLMRRVKDMYDLYCYSFMREFRYTGIKDAMLLKHSGFYTEAGIVLSSSYVDKLKHAYDKNNAMPRGKFDEVFTRASIFANPLITLLLKNEEEDYRWDVVSGEWLVLH